MTPNILKDLTSSTYNIKKLNLPGDADDVILDAYMAGLHYIFITYVALQALNCLLCLGIGNTTLKRKAPQKSDNTVDEEKQDVNQTREDGIAVDAQIKEVKVEGKH